MLPPLLIPTTGSLGSLGSIVPTFAYSRLTDLRPWKESGGGGNAWVTFPPDPQPEAKCPSPTANQLLPSTSAFPVPIPCLQHLPPWLGSSLLSGTWQSLLGGGVGENHKQNRQEDVQGAPARDAWRSKRGLCPRQRPLLLSARDRLSPVLVLVSCPLKEGESLLPQQKSFLFHSPVLKPDLDLLVTKIQAV